MGEWHGLPIVKNPDVLVSVNVAHVQEFMDCTEDEAQSFLDAFEDDIAEALEAFIPAALHNVYVNFHAQEHEKRNHEAERMRSTLKLVVG